MRRRALARIVTAIATGGALTAGALALGAAQAGAAGNYGPGAMYQVEISANINPTTFPGALQGNFWVWAALYPSGTNTTIGSADYQETDCVHTAAVHLAVPGQDAAHVAGDATWHVGTTGTVLYLTTVTIIGGLQKATFSIPMPTNRTYGHTHGMTLTVETPGPLPMATFTYPSQNQIAP